MRPNARHALLALLLLIVAPVFAAAPNWAALSAEQQAVVAPAIKGGAKEFDRLPEARRQKLAEGAQRWLGMSADQRLEANRQFDTWQKMSATDRRAALERRERFRKLPRAEQENLLNQQRRFEALPLSEQLKLQEAFRTELDQRSRIAPLNLPTTGSDSLLPPSLPMLAPLPPPSTTPSPTPNLLPQ